MDILPPKCSLWNDPGCRVPSALFMFASYQAVNLRSRACSSCLPPPSGRVSLGHPTLCLVPLSQLVLLTLIALLSEFGERVCGPMFVHVYISLAFEMCWPSVPTELGAILDAFPHFASPLAVRQAGVTTVTHLSTGVELMPRFWPPAAHTVLQIFCRDRARGL